MALQVQFASIESSDDERGHPRRKLFLETQATSPRAEVSSAVIRNLSEKGLLIETAAHLSDGDVIEVDLPRAGPREAIVVWSGERLFGCKFAENLSSGTVGAAILRARFDFSHNLDKTKTGSEVEPYTAGEGLSVRARLAAITGMALLCWSVLVVVGLVIARQI
jgi:hypothetical protein